MATKIAGSPVLSQFDSKSLEYRLIFRPQATTVESVLCRQTEIVIPNLYNTSDFHVVVKHEGLAAQWRHDQHAQTLYFLYAPVTKDTDQTCKLSITFRRTCDEPTSKISWKEQFLVLTFAIFIVLIYKTIKANSPSISNDVV